MVREAAPFSSLSWPGHSGCFGAAALARHSPCRFRAGGRSEASFSSPLFLRTLNTQLRVQAKGSTSFIMHMAAGLALWWLVGWLWLPASSTLLGEIVREESSHQGHLQCFTKNSRCCGSRPWSTTALGGQLPPTYLTPAELLSSDVVQRDLGALLRLCGRVFPGQFGSWSTCNCPTVQGAHFGRSGISIRAEFWYTILAQV